MITPGFCSFHFINVASFFQTVAPLNINALSGNLYRDWTSPSSQSESSLASSVNQHHVWYTEGYDPTLDDNRNVEVKDEEPEYSFDI